ncbi:MAG: nucleotidyltransferase [Bdellovibrionaceae bacterium]|nr:nucleotidyltransferase [Pseudobdellovibrionaceae bacterium]
MKSLLDVLNDVVKRFDEAGIEYFLVGSLATMYYGRPRFTQDVDLVVRIKAKQVLKFQTLFPIEE